MSSLPPLPSLEIIAQRLPIIIPNGTSNRNYCIRSTAIKTIYTMIYIGAVEGTGILLAPKQAYRMTDEQSTKVSDVDRTDYLQKSISNDKTPISGTRWYQDNTREALRDETLKEGLIPIGVVSVDTTIPTTSSKGRYALNKSFYNLLNPLLISDQLAKAIQEWQEENLSRSSLARIRLLMSGGDVTNKIQVRVNNEIRSLDPGPSSLIAKAVVEEFAPRFLSKPFLLWLSESGNKVVQRDDDLAADLGIIIDVSKHLPDIILVDLEDKNKFRIVFVEVVATDGPVTSARQKAFYELTKAYEKSQVLFVTAYMDRDAPAFKKTISQLAWNSFAWFASEPDNIFILKEGVIKLNEIKF